MTVVLMYHGVGDEPAPHGELRYTVSEERFAAQMARLGRARCAIPLPDVVAGRGGSGRVAVTFDDGEASVVRAALPVMEQQGLVGAVFVTTGWVDRPGYLGAEDLRLLADRGWTVGTHGVTHRYLSDLDDAALHDELVQSRDALTLILGRAPLHMSLPGGRADGRVVRAARRAGYASMATSVVGINPKETDPFALLRATVLRQTGEEAFAAMTRPDEVFMLRLRARQVALDGAKRLLGNRGYDALRRVALGVVSRRRPGPSPT